MRSLTSDISVEEILELRRCGLSNTEIAQRLDVSAQTVWKYIGKNPPEIIARIKKDGALTRSINRLEGMCVEAAQAPVVDAVEKPDVVDNVAPLQPVSVRAMFDIGTVSVGLSSGRFDSTATIEKDGTIIRFAFGDDVSGVIFDSEIDELVNHLTALKGAVKRLRGGVEGM